MSKRLLSSPLFSQEEKKDTQEKKVLDEATVKRGKPKKDLLVRGGVQDGLTEEWTRACFIVRVEILEKLKDMAYTDRIKIKDALDLILTDYLNRRGDLIQHK